MGRCKYQYEAGDQCGLVAGHEGLHELPDDVVDTLRTERDALKAEVEQQARLIEELQDSVEAVWDASGYTKGGDLVAVVGDMRALVGELAEELEAQTEYIDPAGESRWPAGVAPLIARARRAIGGEP